MPKEEYAPKKKKAPSRFERLYNEGIAKQRVKDKKHAEKVKGIDDECTFVPRTNNRKRNRGQQRKTAQPAHIDEGKVEHTTGEQPEHGEEYVAGTNETDNVGLSRRKSFQEQLPLINTILPPEVEKQIRDEVENQEIAYLRNEVAMARAQNELLMNEMRHLRQIVRVLSFSFKHQEKDYFRDQATYLLHPQREELFEY